ncbi:MAG: hypothetical protein QOC64_1266, partial [Solirubrobacteraceae bacterium]|nr:hypothetical protein [Solirubrobacteraceae bacterium]
ALAAAVVAAVLISTGGSDPERGGADRTTAAGERPASTGRRSTATAERSGTTPAPAPAAGPDTPEGAVQAFYGHAAAHRYDEAWALAAPSLRSQLGGFDAFRSQFSSVRSIEFSRAETVQREDAAATVAIATTATHTDRVDRCAGTVATAAGPDGGWVVSRLAVNC